MEDLVEGFERIDNRSGFQTPGEDGRERRRHLLYVEEEGKQRSNGHMMREEVPTPPAKDHTEANPIDETAQGGANKLVLHGRLANNLTVLTQPCLLPTDALRQFRSRQRRLLADRRRPPQARHVTAQPAF